MRFLLYETFHDSMPVFCTDYPLWFGHMLGLLEWWFKNEQNPKTKASLAKAFRQKKQSGQWASELNPEGWFKGIFIIVLYVFSEQCLNGNICFNSDNLN